MRKLSKPWPPPNISPDGQVPGSLVEAEQQFLAELPTAADKAAFARSRYEALDKPKLRAVMYREQSSICAYCERRIEEAQPVPRIDHWRPLSANPELALLWKNLYLSCATKETCDSAKGSRELRCDPADEVLPWPTDQRYERMVGFSSLGEIYVRSDVGLDPARRRSLRLAIGDGVSSKESILNLNHPALVAARQAALDSERGALAKAFPNRRAPSADRKRRARQLLRQRSLPQFISIRVRWLRRTLGQGS